MKKEDLKPYQIAPLTVSATHNTLMRQITPGLHYSRYTERRVDPKSDAQQGYWKEGVAVADHIENRLRTWRQQHTNLSGDRLALDDFMGEESISDLVDFVCDVYAIDAILSTNHRTHKKPDCGEAGHDEGRCGNASCF